MHTFAEYKTENVLGAYIFQLTFLNVNPIKALAHVSKVGIPAVVTIAQWASTLV